MIDKDDDRLGRVAIVVMKVLVLGPTLFILAKCHHDWPRYPPYEQPTGMYTVISGADVFEIAGLRMTGTPYNDEMLSWKDHNPYVLRQAKLYVREPTYPNGDGRSCSEGPTYALVNRTYGQPRMVGHLDPAKEMFKPTENTALEKASVGARLTGWSVYGLIGNPRYYDGDHEPIRIYTNPSVEGSTRVQMRFALTRDTFVEAVKTLPPECDIEIDLSKVADALLDDLDALRR